MTSDDIPTINRDLAQRLLDEAQSNPKSPYAGKFVGIANGQVVAIADDWDDLARQLHQIEPDLTRTFGVEVGRDYSKVDTVYNSR